jgi:hypothetical protein
MTRSLRVEFSGAVYPVTSRGKEREPIFPDGRDKIDSFVYLWLRSFLDVGNAKDE